MATHTHPFRPILWVLLGVSYLITTHSQASHHPPWSPSTPTTTAVSTHHKALRVIYSTLLPTVSVKQIFTTVRGVKIQIEFLDANWPPHTTSILNNNTNSSTNSFYTPSNQTTKKTSTDTKFRNNSDTYPLLPIQPAPNFYLQSHTLTVTLKFHTTIHPLSPSLPFWNDELSTLSYIYTTPNSEFFFFLCDYSPQQPTQKHTSSWLTTQKLHSTPSTITIL